MLKLKTHCIGFRVMAGLATLSVLPQTGFAQRGRGNFRDVTKMPGGVIGEHVKGLLDAINANNEQVSRSFLKEHFAENVQSESFVNQEADLFRDVYNGSGGLTFHSIRRFETQQPDQVVVIVRNNRTKGWQGVLLTVQADPPNKIEAVRFTAAQAPRQTTSASGSDSEQMVTELRHFVERLAKAGSFCGSVLLAKDGKVLFKGAYGLASRRYNIPNKVDTKFNLGSMNKMFTSVAITQLVQQGRLSLDDPLSKFVSTDWLPHEVADKIKIKHLLTHTSGLGSYFNETFERSSRAMFRELNDYKPLIVDSTLAFEPGTQWQYSNTGMFMLGVVIESVTGENYFDYIRKHIYEPAGMINSDCYDMDRPVPNLAMGYSRETVEDNEPPWSNNLYKHVIRGGPAGGGFSTIEDLLRFDIALRSHKLLDEKHTEMIWSAKPEWNSPTYGFGFDVQQVPGDRIVGHSGGFNGINSNLDMFLDSGYTAAVMSNVDRGAGPVQEKMRSLIALYR